MKVPNSEGMYLLLCYNGRTCDNISTPLIYLLKLVEGVYVHVHGNVLKDVVLQWGEVPNSVAHTSNNQIIIWGNKAIEIRKVTNGQIMGIFTHKRDQKTKFLNEKNEKVGPYFYANL